MKKLKFYMAFILCLVLIQPYAQSPFKGGNIVVVRIGNGTSALGGTAAPVFLDEYSPSGTLVQSLPMPTVDNGDNKKFVLSGNRTILGCLTRSADNRFLSMFGYDAIPEAASTVLLNTNTLKTIARIDYNGIINTTTAIPGSQITSNVAGAVTNDGNNFWSVNSGTGIWYTTFGSTGSASSILNSGSFHNLAIVDGELFAGITNGRMGHIGTGLPVTGPQSSTILPGISSPDGGPQQAFFADLNPSIVGPDVAYIAYEGENALIKYSLVDGNWEPNGSIGVNEDDYHYIDGVVIGNSVTLYVTRQIGVNTTGGGELVTLTDASGYNGTFTGTPTVLATAPFQTSFRGVAIAPQPLSVSLSTKAFLAGEYNSGLARHTNVTPARVNALNANALSQPFNVAPFNYAGTESVSAGFFSTDDGVATDIVDWVLVELHDATTPSTIIARKACFIREDGKIVDLDKVSDPSFTGVGANNYYIVIKARNHLAIRSSTTVFVNGATPVLYDFTTAQAKAYQNPAVTTNAAMRDFAGAFCMWSGNANMNNNVRYTGLNNDAAALLAALSGNQASVLNPSYHPADINGDGIVRYTGLNNDAAALLSSLGGNQAAVLTEHQ